MSFPLHIPMLQPPLFIVSVILLSYACKVYSYPLCPIHVVPLRSISLDYSMFTSYSHRREGSVSYHHITRSQVGKIEAAR